MDVTPELIEQIDFTEKFRGYDQDQVDDFLERVGATISRLTAELSDRTERLRQAEAMAGAAQAAPTPEPAPAPEPEPAPQPMAAPEPRAASEEAQAQEATRTLMMAQRTADATVAEAREEAERLIRDAETTRDEAMTSASGEAEALVAGARGRAEAEYQERVSEVVAELTRLEDERTRAKGALDGMEGRVEEYRGALSGIETSIRGFLEDPASLGERPPLDIDASPLAVETSALSTEPDENESVPAAFGHGEPFSAPVGSPLDSLADSGDERDSDDLEVQPGAFTEPVVGSVDDAPEAWGPGSWSQLAESEESPSAAGEGAFAPEPGAPERFDASVEPAGSAFLPDLDAETDEAPGAFDFMPVSGDDASGAVGGAPTEVHESLSADPFMADLDAAVNSEEESNDAMAAFFEGDNDPELRRFGRRR